jgi:hypothetical protein
VGDSAETIALLWQQLNPTAALEHEPQAHESAIKEAETDAM